LRVLEIELESEARVPRRKHLRLAGYDYSLAGGYFITICTHERVNLFGTITVDVMELSAAGRVVEEEWMRTGQMRSNVILDEFVVMPNHLHAIVLIDYPANGWRQPDEPRQRLERIVAGFKAACTRRINEIRRGIVWQRSFNDQIIRGEKHLEHPRRYVDNNVRRWALDSENRERNTDI
jgi:putative transposase